MASGRRSRSRSSVPHTPTTPTDAGQVSDHDDMLIMRFDCNVIMSSGESLRSFRCDELTSIGYIRNSVLQILLARKERQLQILPSMPRLLLPKKRALELASFRLLRGKQICRNDYTKVYELFPNMTSESCLLTVVLLQGHRSQRI